MTTIVLARGSKWGIFANAGVYANWGETGPNTDTDATEKKLGNLVVARFEEFCHARDIHARWYPHTSEVIGNIDQDFEEGILEELRDQAQNEIWQEWCDGGIDSVPREVEV